MATIQKRLRIPAEIAQAIEELAQASGRDFSGVATELLTEATKMRQCPGILFADGPAGRRARIAGTGLDVWEVVATYESLGQDVKRLRRVYHWLTETQLQAALGFYRAYPAEIDREIGRNKAWTPERLAKQHPSLAAGRR